MGLGDAEIGETMGLATHTVKGYIGGLAEKLQVNSDKSDHRLQDGRAVFAPTPRVALFAWARSRKGGLSPHSAFLTIAR